MLRLGFWRATALTVCLFPSCAIIAQAANPTAATPTAAHPVIAGFERFYTDPASDAAEGGRLLLGELNCTACHQPDRALRAQLLTRQSPVLTEVGGRVKSQWLRMFLSQPHQTKPGTTMPDVLGHLPSAERREKVEALVHFLAGTAPRPPVDQSADRAAVKRGDQLFHEVGCVACHDARKDKAPALATSVPLGDLAAKYSIASLTTFLKNPTHARPAGRMPNLGLKDQELNDIAHYLLQGITGTPNFTFEYFEGGGDGLDAYVHRKPKGTGKCFGLDLSVARRANNFALRFTGFLRVIDKAEFTFFLNSDDGSRLTIDGVKVVENDGVHSRAERTGKMILDRSAHQFVVEFFNGGGGAELSLEMETKDLQRGDVTGAIALTADAEPPQIEKFAIDAKLAAQGQQFFGELGCAACHELKRDDKALASTLKAPAFTANKLAKLSFERGCVAEQTGVAPRFDLSARQRAALRAAFATKYETPTDPKVAQTAVIAHTMTAMNCYACHARDGRGGPEAERNDYFVTTIKEMGDEGRLPPPLNGVGAKLRVEWLREILTKSPKDRPYMLTRMPQFGFGNVQQLVKAFETVDTFEPLTRPTFDEPPYRVKDQGRHLAGGKAFSCIKCHTFGQYKAEGIQSIDMTAMTRRLRPEWFHSYVRDPLAFRPGTRMPSAWPKTGKSFLPAIYGGDSDKQIAAVWTYLLDGDKAAPPYGVGGQPIELKPAGEPIIYRNFIEGAGPRAIAVGYPEGVNLAWDANNLRLALIWKGAFIDASRHWTGRGNGFQPPLGDHVMPFVDGAPLAVLDDAQAEWPKTPAREMDCHFRGYRLDARRPTFLFECYGVRVEDAYLPIGEATHRQLRRTLSLVSDRALEKLWYRAAAATRIEPQADGWYLIDDSWKLRVEPAGGSSAIVRDSNGRKELLVPVLWTGGKSQIVQTFDW